MLLFPGSEGGSKGEGEVEEGRRKREEEVKNGSGGIKRKEQFRVDPSFLFGVGTCLCFLNGYRVYHAYIGLTGHQGVYGFQRWTRLAGLRDDCLHEG